MLNLLNFRVAKDELNNGKKSRTECGRRRPVGALQLLGIDKIAVEYAVVFICSTDF
jgi:hypothetical protein